MLRSTGTASQASTAAPKIDTLLDVMIVLSSFVFSIVMVMLFYALWKFRAKPGDESDGEPIHGNTRLEIAWTVIPTVIVLFGAGYSWIVLDNLEAQDARRDARSTSSRSSTRGLRLPAKGGPWSHELHVPVDRQLDIHLHALDVIHSFWVPEWRIKRDLVPAGSGGNDVDNTVESPRTGSASTPWSAPSCAASGTRPCGPLRPPWSRRRTSTSCGRHSRRRRAQEVRADGDSEEARTPTRRPRLPARASASATGWSSPCGRSRACRSPRPSRPDTRSSSLPPSPPRSASWSAWGRSPTGSAGRPARPPCPTTTPSTAPAPGTTTSGSTPITR